MVGETPTTAAEKYLGSAGWTNASMYSRRSAYVSAEYLIANKLKLEGATLEFEKALTSNGINSVSDIKITKRGGAIIQIETKAGNEFFTFLEGSNFSPQSYNMLMNVKEITDLKVPLNSIVKASLDDPAIFLQQKMKVINVWKNWNNGLIFSERKIITKFEALFDTEILNSAQLEQLLTQNDNWFDLIFKNNDL